MNNKIILFIIILFFLSACSAATIQTDIRYSYLPVINKRPRLIGTELENNKPIANYPEFPKNAVLKQPASWYFIENDGWARLDNALDGWHGTLWLTVKGCPYNIHPEYCEYDHPMSPISLHGYNAWTMFVQTIIDNYADDVETLYIEVWNEPDAPLQPLELGGAHWGGYGSQSGAEYGQLVDYTISFAEVPHNVRFVAGALVSTETEFLYNLIQTTDKMDYISAHAYEFYPTETYELCKIQGVNIHKFTRIPVVCSETAYITYGEPTANFIALHNQYMQYLLQEYDGSFIHYNYRRSAGSWAESQLDYGRGLEEFLEYFK